MLDQVADHLAEIIDTGTPKPAQGPSPKHSFDRVIITGPVRLVPVFRIPQPVDANGPHPFNQRKRPRTVRFAR
jgi:hypothetical protein